MALELEEKKVTTVHNVLNLTVIPLINFSLHSYDFSHLPTYVKEESENSRGWHDK